MFTLLLITTHALAAVVAVVLYIVLSEPISRGDLTRAKDEIIRAMGGQPDGDLKVRKLTKQLGASSDTLQDAVNKNK